MQNKISTGKFVGCLAYYFVVYFFILSILVSCFSYIFTRDPMAIHGPSATILYYAYMIGLFVMLYPQYRQAFQKFKDKIWLNILIIIAGFIVLLIVNCLTGIFVDFFATSDNSVNQEYIEQSMLLNPVIMCFLTVVFAPIVEESVFRGCLMQYCIEQNKPRLGFILSAVIFGTMHCLDAVLLGNISDLWFLIVYISLGGVLSFIYARSNLYCSIGAHMLYNAFATILTFMM